MTVIDLTPFEMDKRYGPIFVSIHVEHYEVANLAISGVTI